MVAKRPVAAEQLLVKWTEFMAEFKTLRNLVPAGQKLNFFQFYSLDVMARLFSVLLVIFWIVYKILACSLRYLYSRIINKKQKSQ